MDFLLVIEIAPERVELLVPELLVMGQPHRGLLHRFRGELAPHDAPFLGPRNQARVFQHAQVLHEAGQGHAVRLRELGHGRAALLAQPFEDIAPRRVRKRPENAVENHVVVGHLQVEGGSGQAFRQPETDMPPGEGCSMLTRLPSGS